MIRSLSKHVSHLHGRGVWIRYGGKTYQQKKTIDLTHNSPLVYSKVEWQNKN
jgi:hypothetical protein